jgi:hypothetical protein
MEAHLSGERCPSCNEAVGANSAFCNACGFALRSGAGASATSRAGIHPAAPLVFILAGLAAAGAATLVVSLAVAIPLGLFGGGLGVWVLERGRRLR